MKKAREGFSRPAASGPRVFNAYVAMALPLLVGLLALVFYSFSMLGGAPLLPLYPGDGLAKTPVKDWLKAHPMPTDMEVYPLELTRTALSSVSVVQVRGREPRHVHLKHDLAVTVLKGWGLLEFGDKTLKIVRGRTVLIPAGTPHAFINKASSPSAALVISSPPYDPKDMKKAEK